jgi:hypothetical protein
MALSVLLSTIRAKGSCLHVPKRDARYLATASMSQAAEWSKGKARGASHLNRAFTELPHISFNYLIVQQLHEDA